MTCTSVSQQDKLIFCQTALTVVGRYRTTMKSSTINKSGEDMKMGGHMLGSVGELRVDMVMTLHIKIWI